MGRKRQKTATGEAKRIQEYLAHKNGGDFDEEKADELVARGIAEVQARWTAAEELRHQTGPRGDEGDCLHRIDSSAFGLQSPGTDRIVSETM